MTKKVIAAARGNQRHVLAHGQERNDAEEDQRANGAESDSHREDGRHFPPGADAGVQVIDGGAAGVALAARFQDLANQRGDDKQGKYAAIEPDQFRVVEHGEHQAFPIRRRLATASRARSRKSSLCSSGSTWMGLPKVSRLSMGTGRNSPLGKMRFRFSRYAGTSSTSGR